jgi:hypothetical protein
MAVNLVPKPSHQGSYFTININFLLLQTLKFMTCLYFNDSLQLKEMKDQKAAAKKLLLAQQQAAASDDLPLKVAAAPSKGAKKANGPSKPTKLAAKRIVSAKKPLVEAAAAAAAVDESASAALKSTKKRNRALAQLDTAPVEAIRFGKGAKGLLVGAMLVGFN